MKSFATLCLLGIGLAVQLDKKDGGKCGPPKKCLGEIGDAELELIKGDVMEGLKDRDVPSDKAEEAGQDLVDAQKAGIIKINLKQTPTNTMKSFATLCLLGIGLAVQLD